ncbi:MAG: FeoB-associated Cys-rich membrane protein [Candidatus Pacearchaeota archaeon]
MEESENIVENKKFNLWILVWVVVGIIVLAVIGFAIYSFILAERDNLPESGENITTLPEQGNLESEENITTSQEFNSEAEEEIFSQFGDNYNPPAVN